MGHRVQAGVGPLQNAQKILLRHSPIRRVNQLPPSLHRLANLLVGFFTLYSRVDKLVHLAFHCLIGNRNLLRHLGSLSSHLPCNKLAKLELLNSLDLRKAAFYELEETLPPI